MKKILLFASIVVISITSKAEDSLVPEPTLEKKLEHISDSTPTMLSAPEQIIPAESGGNNSNLWEMLDTDYDGFLSKTEAASSKDVFDNWDNLDINKDEKLDSAEFAKVFYQEN